MNTASLNTRCLNTRSLPLAGLLSLVLWLSLALAASALPASVVVSGNAGAAGTYTLVPTSGSSYYQGPGSYIIAFTSNQGGSFWNLAYQYGGYTSTGGQTYASGPVGPFASGITVALPSTPPTCSLSAGPSSIVSGASSTLSYTSANVTALTISPGVGSVPVSGVAVAVSPTSTTTYTLMATGPGGSTSSTATVTVTPAPPTASIAVSPGSVSASGTANLSWSSSGASSVTVTGQPSPALSGTASVSPLATATYTISATGPGGTVSRSCTLTVTPPAGTTGGGTTGGSTGNTGTTAAGGPDTGVPDLAMPDTGVFNGTVGPTTELYLKALIKNFGIPAIFVVLMLSGWLLVRRWAKGTAKGA